MLEPGESRAGYAWLLSADAMSVGAVETVFGETLAAGAVETVFGETLAAGTVEAVFGEALTTGAVKAILGIAGGLSGRCREGMRMGAIESIFGRCACGKCEKGEGQEEFAFHVDAPE